MEDPSDGGYGLTGSGRDPSVPDGPRSWPDVLEEEYRALYGTDPFDGVPPRDPSDRLQALHHALHQRRPAALCLSGGGIRSATFGLGVLRRLPRPGFSNASTICPRYPAGATSAAG